MEIVREGWAAQFLCLVPDTSAGQAAVYIPWVNALACVRFYLAGQLVRQTLFSLNAESFWVNGPTCLCQKARGTIFACSRCWALGVGVFA